MYSNFRHYVSFMSPVYGYLKAIHCVSLMMKHFQQVWAAPHCVWISINLIKTPRIWSRSTYRQWVPRYMERRGRVVNTRALHSWGSGYSFGAHFACYDRGIPWVSFIHPDKCIYSSLQHHPYISKRGSRRHNKEVNQILIKYIKIGRNISGSIKLTVSLNYYIYLCHEPSHGLKIYNYLIVW